MRFIKRLGGLQRTRGSKAQFTVGVPLKCCKVKQLRWQLFPGSSRYAAYPGFLAGDGFGNGFRRFTVCDSVVGFIILDFRIKPLPLIISKICRDGAKPLRHEVPDILCPLDQESQGRRLNPAHGEERAIFERKGPAGIHAHQPIRLGAAKSALIKAIIGTPGLYPIKAFLDSRVRERADPKPANRLETTHFFIDHTENQLALTARVCGADDPGNACIQHQAPDNAVLRAGFGNDLGGQRFRQDRQVFHAPFFVLRINFIRFA